MNSAQENSDRCRSGVSSSALAAHRKGGVAVAVGVNLDDHRLGRGPLGIDQQRLGVSRDLLSLGEDRLDRAGVLLAGDDLPGQRQHEIVALVPVGGEAVLR